MELALQELTLGDWSKSIRGGGGVGQGIWKCD